MGSNKGAVAMVTLLTEQLQHQSLIDCPCWVYGLSPTDPDCQTIDTSIREPEQKSVPGQTHSSSCADSHCPTYGTRACPGEKSSHTPRPAQAGCHGPSDGTATLLGWSSSLNLNERHQLPLCPPTKRHCRSLSEPNKGTTSQSPWKPAVGSRIWTTVVGRRGSTSSPSLTPPFVTSLGAEPPRPSSASSGFVDGSERSDASSSSSAPRWSCDRSSDGSPDYTLCCPLSLSQESLAEAGPRPRCHSQPSELQEPRSGLKRRRGEDGPWLRPALDFLKMTRSLTSTRSLCSLDCDEGGDSPQDYSLLPHTITSGCIPSSEAETPLQQVRGFQPCRLRFSSTPALPESDEDCSDCECAETSLCPPGCADLDLEEIEKN